jgi:hypothetical protein
VANLYIVLFDYIEANPSYSGHGSSGYFFGENGEHFLVDISKAIGKAMVALGKAKDPAPTTFTDDEIRKYFGGVSPMTHFYHTLADSRAVEVSRK